MFYRRQPCFLCLNGSLTAPVMHLFGTSIDAAKNANFSFRFPISKKLQKSRRFKRNSGLIWYARCDSNARPLESESNALSS